MQQVGGRARPARPELSAMLLPCRQDRARAKSTASDTMSEEMTPRGRRDAAGAPPPCPARTTRQRATEEPQTVPAGASLPSGRIARPPTNQPTNQPINHQTNQPTNQPITHEAGVVCSRRRLSRQGERIGRRGSVWRRLAQAPRAAGGPGTRASHSIAHAVNVETAGRWNTLVPHRARSDTVAQLNSARPCLGPRGATATDRDCA